eukprot:scaffold13384_cov54-Phaeocystis_antarctica.AAC.2
MKTVIRSKWGRQRRARRGAAAGVGVALYDGDARRGVAPVLGAQPGSARRWQALVARLGAADTIEVTVVLIEAVLVSDVPPQVARARDPVAQQPEPALLEEGRAAVLAVAHVQPVHLRAPRALHAVAVWANRGTRRRVAPRAVASAVLADHTGCPYGARPCRQPCRYSRSVVGRRGRRVEPRRRRRRPLDHLRRTIQGRLVSQCGGGGGGDGGGEAAVCRQQDGRCGGCGGGGGGGAGGSGKGSCAGGAVLPPVARAALGPTTTATASVRGLLAALLINAPLDAAAREATDGGNH